MYYGTDVNLNDRAEMIRFLSNHTRYYTMNSWNKSTSFAHNIKMYNMGLPDSITEKAYDFLQASCEEYDFQIRELICEFENETGYSAGFNGRSSGYIVLYDTERRNGKLYALVGRNIGQYEDFNEFATDELVEWTTLVQRFDKLCDDIRTLFIETVTNCEIKTETIFVPTERMVAIV